MTIELKPVCELLRRVGPKWWPMGAPLIPSPTPDEVQAAREVLAEADPWTRLFYATRYPALFGDLEPHPWPQAVRD